MQFVEWAIFPKHNYVSKNGAIVIPYICYNGEWMMILGVRHLENTDTGAVYIIISSLSKPH
jgi:hypothetical protein